MKRKLSRDAVDLEVPPQHSGAWSDSSCDSGAMEVQRIHSGLPVQPESCISGDPNSTRQIIGQLFFRSANRCASATEEPIAARRANQRSGAFTALPKAALQQLLALLEGDEQALLAELRALRREYDARVAALQPSAPSAILLPTAHKPMCAASLPHPVLPLPLQQLGLYHQQRLQLVDANVRHIGLDAHLGQHCQTMQAHSGLPDADAAAGSTSSAAFGGRHDATALKSMMPPPPPPPQPYAAQRGSAQSSGQDRARKPPVAARPSPSLNQPYGAAQAAGPGPAPALGAGAGASVRSTDAASASLRGSTDGPLPPDAQLLLGLGLGLPSAETTEGQRGCTGAAAAAAHHQPQLQLSADVVEALLRNGGGGGGGGGALMGNLLAQLLQRGCQQPSAATVAAAAAARSNGV
ncbi:hypothetical protein PLESTB_001384700 [Pleodorina starrii]|uniref:Uncharacterized protein n=1 Tax=Pleodorina starrii TaxID=330485 RepID=A0A9W6BUK2_9CHLO|nr:hypothetical protein PLESTM_000947600 [Pleodorina starrii]GLC57742.1 hypothetical protein PLESTB_001259700 [Pleodorina starrii]GLC58654.1 hypothetical protein PLESTB_001384700 [Pleodorina starrii]